MRKFAFIAGIVWLAGLAAAGAVFFVSGHFSNVRDLMYALIGCALPGFVLLHWGARKRHLRALPSPLDPKAPYDRAAEAGHVMRIDSGA